MPTQQIIDLDPDEQLIHRVVRTKIGLVPIVASGAIVFIGMLVAVYLIARFRDTVADTVPIGIALTLVIGLAVLVGLLVFVAVLVYLGNQLLVTNERIVNIIQNSLFHRQASQLSLDDIQEVTVKQATIFESLFHYGLLYIETAGEGDNFSFKLAKDPYAAAKQIDEVREKFGAPKD